MPTDSITAVCSDFDDRMIFYKDQLTDHGISFCGAAKAVARTGNAQTDYYAWKMGYAEASLDITDTNDFVLYLAVSTDYRGKNPDRCFYRLKRQQKKVMRLYVGIISVIIPLHIIVLK